MRQSKVLPSCFFIVFRCFPSLLLSSFPPRHFAVNCMRHFCCCSVWFGSLRFGFILCGFCVSFAVVVVVVWRREVFSLSFDCIYICIYSRQCLYIRGLYVPPSSSSMCMQYPRNIFRYCGGCSSFFWVSFSFHTAFVGVVAMRHAAALNAVYFISLFFVAFVFCFLFGDYCPS